MKTITRTAFQGYTSQLARINATDSIHYAFTVAPSVQQTLESKMQESSEFLKKINIIGVVEQEGEKLGLGISGPVASRINTDKADRQTRDLSTLDHQRYRCEKTNFDTHIKYQTLDAWAKFPDFQARLAGVIMKRQALDRMVIGFNGASVADDTDIVKNPLLQDVNIGWLTHYRQQAPQRVLREVKQGSGQIGVGAGGDYANLDAVVYDAIQLLDPWYRNDSGLVAIIGRALLHDKYFPIINTQQKPTETLAADIIISQKRLGGLPAVTVPYFPDHAILITRFDNLSIYYQEGARRRRLVDEAKRDRIENYESSNDAYVVEDYGLGALVENIHLLTDTAPTITDTPKEHGVPEMDDGSMKDDTPKKSDGPDNGKQGS